MAIAALLLVVAMVLVSRIKDQVRDQDRVAAFRASQIVFSLIPALLLLFFAAADRIKWDVLQTPS